MPCTKKKKEEKKKRFVFEMQIFLPPLIVVAPRISDSVVTAQRCSRRFQPNEAGVDMAEFE